MADVSETPWWCGSGTRCGSACRVIQSDRDAVRPRERGAGPPRSEAKWPGRASSAVLHGAMDQPGMQGRERQGGHVGTVRLDDVLVSFMADEGRTQIIPSVIASGLAQTPGCEVCFSSRSARTLCGGSYGRTATGLAPGAYQELLEQTVALSVGVRGQTLGETAWVETIRLTRLAKSRHRDLCASWCGKDSILA